MVVPAHELTVLGLAAGTGMLEEGVGVALEAIGLRAKPVGYVEREASAAASLVARMEQTRMGFAPIWDDLGTFDGSAWRGCVDIIAAGYPCQPFSLAGKRRGTSDGRHLWPHLRRAIATIKPGIVFLENVPGHLSLGFKEVYQDLCELGYQVTAGLFSAEETGASHKRERLFILGLAHGVGTRWQERPGGRSDPPSQCTPSQRGSGKLGDAHSHGRQQVTRSAPGHEGTHEGWRTFDHYITERAGQGMDAAYLKPSKDIGELADPKQPRSRSGIKGKQGPATKQRWDRPADYRDGLPLFAPARNDFRSWTAVANVAPTLMPATEPQLRGVADGLVSRSNRLRLVGNGVVALAAAYAFITLFASFGATIDEPARRIR